MKLRKLLKQNPVEAYHTIKNIIEEEVSWDDFLYHFDLVEEDECSCNIEDDFCDDEIEMEYKRRDLAEKPFENMSITQEIWLDDMWEQSKNVI